MTTTGTLNGCPVDESFDPLSPGFLADPYAAMAALPRQEQPIFFAPSIGYYVLTRYADIEQVFQDAASYSAAVAQAPLVPLVPEAQQILLAGGHKPQPSMVSLDEPEHARLRKPAAPGVQHEAGHCPDPRDRGHHRRSARRRRHGGGVRPGRRARLPAARQYRLLADGRARAGLRPDQALERVPGRPRAGGAPHPRTRSRSRPAWPPIALICENWSTRRQSSPVTT